MAEAVALAGATADRQRMLEALTPLAGTHVVAGGLATYAGPADYYRALLAGALDQPEQAAEHYRAAAAAADRLGATHWAGLCRDHLAALTSEATGQATFRRDVGVWMLTGAGSTARLPEPRDSPTSRPCSPAPGEPVHAVTLATGQPPSSGADPLLDPTAVAAHRARLRQLDIDLTAAESHHDLHRLERLRDERDALLHELGQAIRPGGARAQARQRR